ncbi:hypothetical protein GOBAR_AA34991 [Gossypium barbadense]|uniref:Uncharacterized protein n=1 Tax=Gossypium barbadense TaxID=3634 RepID=A0A2P5W3Q9_GOSBA|nr:hypothetical protein GOBAR_AA34991 [Gossypium barbadense]
MRVARSLPIHITKTPLICPSPHTTNAWHENYEGKNPTGTLSSQDRAYKLNLHPPVSRYHQRDLVLGSRAASNGGKGLARSRRQGADGLPTWEAQGVPNMTGENGKAKLKPIAMHKPPQEIFARYREPGTGVVCYISIGMGLTSAGYRPTTVGESLWDYPTPVGAVDAPHLGFEGGHVGGQRISTS